MKTIIIAYVIAIVITPAIDAVWLSTMSQRFYGVYIGHLMSASPKILPIVLFYLIYALSLTALVTVPAIHGGFSLPHVFLMGALLGVAAYGAYDFTNHATLRDWPTIVTVVDLLWGTTLTGIVATIATYLTRVLA